MNITIAVADLPFVEAARSLELFERYLKCRDLGRARHLPLKFFVDVCTLSPGHASYCSESWGRMHHLFRGKNAPLDKMIKAYALTNDRERFEAVLFKLCLNKQELELFDEINRNYIAMYLVVKGVITPEFAITYSRWITGHSWRKVKKISINPGWEQLPSGLASQLYLGLTPVQVARESGTELTRSEASLWLQELILYYSKAMLRQEERPERLLREQMPFFWLGTRLGLDPDTIKNIRSFYYRLMLEWVARKKDLASMTKTRVAYGPGGSRKTYRFIDILDELLPPDLGDLTSPKKVLLNASPEQVFAAAAERRYRNYMSRHGDNMPLPALELKASIPGICQLLTTKELHEEGFFMHHCVGGYADSCIAGHSFVFVVQDEHGRSTVEVCPISLGGYDPFATDPLETDLGYRLVQHRSFNNTDPCPAHQRLVSSWCEANNIAHPGDHAALMAA